MHKHQSQRKTKLQKTSTPQQAAKAAAKLYSQAPLDVTARVILDLAKQANISQQADTMFFRHMQANKLATANYPVKADPENKSWFERNIYSKAKATSRWAFCGITVHTRP
jgi:hypothetical protein